MNNIDDIYEQNFADWDYSFGADADTFDNPEDNYALFLLRAPIETIEDRFGVKNAPAILARARKQLTGDANGNVRICGDLICF